MSSPAASAQWLFDHALGEWVYGYLLPAGDLRDGAVAARIEHVTPPTGSVPA